MSGETKKDLPDPTDSEALAAWLADKPRPLVVAFAVRMALMALPGLGQSAAKDSGPEWRANMVLPPFRAVSASLAVAKYPGQATRDAAAAHNTINEAAASAAAAAIALDPKRYAAEAANAVLDIAYANIKSTIGLETVLTTRDGAIVTTRDGAPILSGRIAELGIRGQIVAALNEVLTADSRPDGIAWYISRPVWIDRNLPSAIQELWVKLRGNLPQSEYWDVWLDWAEARFRGGPDWPKDVYDELTKWREEWQQDPAVVNADIKRLLEKHRRKDAPEKEPLEEPSPTPNAVELTRQQPASFEFWQDSDQVFARAVPSPPFDPVFAQTLIDDLIEKCRHAASALSENNADENIKTSVSRFAELLQKPSGALEVARVLSRTITIESHRDALFDVRTESDRTIRALVDDVAKSARVLLGLYPDIERINAALLALQLQAGHAKDVEKSLRDLEERALSSGHVDKTALQALSEGRVDFDELGRKAMVVSLEASAKYIEAQARIVGARLVNAMNFMSAMVSPYLVKGAKLTADAAKAVGAEALKDAKKIKDKAIYGIGEGVKATAKYGTIAAVLMLADSVLPLWTSISANARGLVPYVAAVTDALKELLKKGG